MSGEPNGEMPNAPQERDPLQAQVDQYQNEIAEKNRRLAMLEEENDIRRLREMRKYEEDERAAAASSKDDDLGLEPEAQAVLDKAIERKIKALRPDIKRVEDRLNQQAAEIDTAKTYAKVRELAPFIDEVGSYLVAHVNRLPVHERQAILSSPTAMASLATVIHSHMKSAGQTIDSAKSQASGARPGALGGSRQIGNQSAEPAYRTAIANAKPGSPEWYEAKEQVAAERRRQLAL